MAAKLTRLTHKIAIQLHVVAESCTICSSRSRQPVWKLLDTSSNLFVYLFIYRSANLSLKSDHQKLKSFHLIHFLVFSIINNMNLALELRSGPRTFQLRSRSSEHSTAILYDIITKVNILLCGLILWLGK